MDKILRNRLKLRHTMLKELCAKATNIKSMSQSEGVTLQELTETRIKLVAAINNFEKDFLKLAELSIEVDANEQEIYMYDQMKAEELSCELEAIKQSNTQGNNESRPGGVKLPKLELPKFNGDILKWPEFWDKFDSNIHSQQMKNVDKLSYLFSSMEGKALDALRGIDITNNNYDIALEALKNRFGDRSLVVDAHYEALSKLPQASNRSLRSTLDTIIKHIRILKSLGEDTKGNYLRGLVGSKFPDGIVYELNLLTPRDRDLEVTLEGLEKIINAKERSKPSVIQDCEGTDHPTEARHSTEAFHVKEKRVLKRKPMNPVFNSHVKKPKIECAFCSKPHFSDRCKLHKTFEERKGALKNKCFRCFKPGHSFRRCTERRLCHYCQGKHNRALCLQQLRSNEASKKTSSERKDTPDQGQGKYVPISDKIDSDCMYINGNTFLQTATTKIKNEDVCTPARLLLDCGSQRSYITSKLANYLHLPVDTEDKLTIFTFGSNVPSEIISPSTEITIVTKRGTERTLRVNIVPHITDRIQLTQLPINENVDIPADDDVRDDNVDLLIGNDYYFSFLRDNYIKLDSGLYLIDTDFGWTISGRPVEQRHDDLSVITYCQCHGTGCPYFTEPDPPLRNIDLKFLWTLESIGIKDSPKATREDEAITHFNSSIKYSNGRYEVKWPWIEYPPELPTNFGLSYGRLKSLLKRADEATLKDYNEIIDEQLKTGIIEEVGPETIPIYKLGHPVHYLPHHMVMQDGKRGRIVYDASAKIKDQKSLNECMYRGPSMLEDLTALLLKFRTGRVGISADVEKAFLQVGLQEEDRDVTRFIWVKDAKKDLTDDNLVHYRFCRVPFGIIASPFLLTATIRHHLSNTNQTLLKKVADRTYVDNLVTGAESPIEAYQLYRETKKSFEDLSMNIRDWISNDKEFMQRIPIQYRAKETVIVKILGLSWNLEDDTLQLKLPKYEKKTSVTKKEVLRTLARLYDPCGFASPYILPVKLMFQQTCVMQLKWDSLLPLNLQQSWPDILENIEEATNVKIPRYVGYDLPEHEVTTRQLHCFTDASKNAYAAVVYLILKGRNHVSTSFIMSKSRITPTEDKEDLKMPRLELLGYLIGSRLLKYVADNLELKIDQKYLWTDSMIVLSWMRTSRLLPPFVSRRVNEIKQHKDFDLRYVPTEMNPADIATRPNSIKLKKELWLSGPEFLKKDEKDWPNVGSRAENTFLLAEEALMMSEDPEMAGKGYEEVEEIDEIQLPVQESNNLDAVTEIKDLQVKYYPDEVAGKQTNLSRNLDLFLDVDGILRCGGRMKNADCSYESKHPILIPKLCDFTNRVIQRIHEENYHVGVSHTLGLIRKRYWIPQGRAQVKRVLKTCPQCVRHGGGPYKLPAAPALPSERVNFSVPFTFTGMDYFGPIFVETSGIKVKRWVCLFTCLAVRAIHLEVVNDLTAEECLLGVRRFVACRGKPALIVSDNATQFKLTSEIFMDSHCEKNRIKWKFIPQLAPWHGGVYERLIAVVKNCLKRTLDKHLLKDGQLMTVIKEVETVVNSRPLTPVTPEIEHILRPADFLTLGSCLELIPPDETREGTSTKIDLLKSWKRGQKIIQEFKMMFRDRYLPSLRERYFQRPKQPRVTSDKSPRVGDLVQIKDDSRNRLNWRVGKISALVEGQDGKCRVAKVQVGNQTFTRSIAHLYPLEAEMESLEKVPTVETLEQEIEMEQDATWEARSPPVVQDTIVEVESPGIPEGSAITPDSSVVIENEANDLCNIPTLDDVEMTAEEVTEEVPVPEANEVAIGVNDRVRREAAIRAREKIAEWTQQLLILL